jgi:hypothetical protein
MVEEQMVHSMQLADEPLADIWTLGHKVRLRNDGRGSVGLVEWTLSDPKRQFAVRDQRLMQ